MNQEIKDKLEQAAKEYIKPFRNQLHLGEEEGLLSDLMDFAQIILENPAEWGLVTKKSYSDLDSAYDNLEKYIKEQGSQLTKYQKTLGIIHATTTDQKAHKIAKEALKQ